MAQTIFSTKTQATSLILKSDLVKNRRGPNRLAFDKKKKKTHSEAWTQYKAKGVHMDVPLGTHAHGGCTRAVRTVQ